MTFGISNKLVKAIVFYQNINYSIICRTCTKVKNVMELEAVAILFSIGLYIKYFTQRNCRCTAIMKQNWEKQENDFLFSTTVHGRFLEVESFIKFDNALTFLLVLHHNHKHNKRKKYEWILRKHVSYI